VSVVVQEPGVGWQVGEAPNAHAPGDAAKERWAFVVGEIVAGAHAKMDEDVPQRLVAARRLRGIDRYLDRPEDVPVREDARGHLGHGQHGVDQTGGYRMPRHLAELG